MRVVAGGSDYAGVNAASVEVTVTDDDGDAGFEHRFARAVAEGDDRYESGDDNSTTVTACLSGAASKAVSVVYADAGTGTAVSPAATGDYAAVTSGNKNLTLCGGRH